MNGLLRQLWRLARRADSGNDAQLLARFSQQRDEDAFAVLVDRYGPLVRSVCRHWLHQDADIDDAFQATFLVLAQRAGAIAQPERLSNWLHGVAWRTARSLRSRLLRQQQRAPANGDSLHLATTNDPLPNDLRPVLDEELSRLPEKYRAPVILCHLQGLTRRQAATQLAIPEGTLSVRLARACVILRRRLLLRGIAPATATVAVSVSASDAAVPTVLLQATVTAASQFVASPHSTTGLSSVVISLTKGVLRMLLLKRISAASALLLLVFTVGAGVGLFLRLQNYVAVSAADPPPLPRQPAGKIEPTGASDIYLVVRPSPSGEPVIDIVEGKETLTAHSIDALDHYFKRLREAKVNLPNPLQITADKSLQFEVIADVANYCKRAGITVNLQVIANREETKSKPNRADSYATFNTRKFAIPLQVDPDKKSEIKSLQLYMSTDLGKSWQQYAQSGSDVKFFTIQLPKDGAYWFQLVTVYNSGRREPPELNQSTEGMKIYVDTHLEKSWAEPVAEVGKPFKLTGAVVGKNESYDLANSKGKVVVIYCCKTSIPSYHNDLDKLKKLQEKYGTRNLELVTIFFDDDEKQVVNALYRFVKPGIHLFPTAGASTQSALANTIPAFYVVNKDGKLVASKVPIDGLEGVVKEFSN
jgi:RNA polymerase sigma factor (sigma-70 family)